MESIKVEYPKAIKIWEIEKLRPYEKNSKKHPEKQIDQIIESIKEFGFCNPILIDQDNGIIAGHGRLEAARKMGLDKVPVIELSHLSEAQKRAYIIADNKIGDNGVWDDEILASELRALDEELDFDIGVIGFDDEELDALFKEEVKVEKLPPKNDSDDTTYDVKVPITKQGDVWILGDHRLICGDSTSVDDLKKLMLGELADLALIDPPSEKRFKENFRTKGGASNNESSGDEFQDFITEACSNTFSFLKNAGSIYHFMDWDAYPLLATIFGDFFEQRALVVWNKNSFGKGTHYRPKHELICFGVKGEGEITWNGGRNEMDVWEIPLEGAESAEHTTRKPILLAQRAIENSSKQGEIILDCFAGGGSTLLAAERVGRIARVVEVEPKCCDVIIKRWQKMTGKEAHLESGESFNSFEEFLEE